MLTYLFTENRLRKNWVNTVIHQSVIIYLKVKTLHIYTCLSFMIVIIQREVEECSSILKEMESILVKYQYDLDHAVEEIQTLQVLLSICFNV